MDSEKSTQIHQISMWLKSTSVCSNGDPNAPITKRDLENFRNKVAEAISAIADLLDE